MITTELERLEYKFATTDRTTAQELDLYIRGSGILRRLLESGGLRRRARNVTPPSLATYLRPNDDDVVDNDVTDEAAE